MAKCAEPGEPGYSYDSSFPLLLHVGFLLAAREGFGIPLYNAVRERFPEMDNIEAANLTSVIGQGNRTAGVIKDMQNWEEFIMDNAPKIPSSMFTDDSVQARFFAMGTTVDVGIDGGEQVRSFTAQFSEGDDFASIWRKAIEDRRQQIETDYPEAEENLQEVLAYFHFVGRRF